MEILSHRGRLYSHEAGNSLDNFEAAYKLGVTGIETDISFSKPDGCGRKKIIICHPGEDQWSAMDLDSFLDMAQKMPGLIWLIDIKELSEELVYRAVKEITEKMPPERIYLTAFQRTIPFLITESNGKLLLLAKKINPQIKTHVIVSWPFNLKKIARKYNADALSIGWLQSPLYIKLISKTIFKCLNKMRNLKKQINKLRSNGTKVWAGIFNDPDDMIYFSKLGADGIMTDNTEVLKTLMAKKKIPC